MLALFAQQLSRLDDFANCLGGRRMRFDEQDDDAAAARENNEARFNLFANCLTNVMSFGVDDDVVATEQPTPPSPSPAESPPTQPTPPPTPAAPALPTIPSDPVRSGWVSRAGMAVPASFWNSDACGRLRWAANPKRNPACRNSRSIGQEGPTINNLLMSTPEGTFYLGWSAAYDGFRYFSDSSNVRRVYLELAAIKYARMFPTVLPDPGVQLPDPNMTDAKRFIANEAGLQSLQRVLLSNNITDDLLEKGRERREKAAAAAALLLEKSSARNMLEALEERKRAARQLAEADPTRLVVDEMIVARDWSPELRTFWLDRVLGSLSFQYGGKLAVIFSTPKNARYGGWSRSDVLLKKRGALRPLLNESSSSASSSSTAAAAALVFEAPAPIISVNRNAAAEKGARLPTTVGVMYQNDDDVQTGGVSYVGGKYRVDLRNETGLSMAEFLAKRKNCIEQHIVRAGNVAPPLLEQQLEQQPTNTTPSFRRLWKRDIRMKRAAEEEAAVASENDQGDGEESATEDDEEGDGGEDSATGEEGDDGEESSSLLSEEEGTATGEDDEGKDGEEGDDDDDYNDDRNPWLPPGRLPGWKK